MGLVLDAICSKQDVWQERVSRWKSAYLNRRDWAALAAATARRLTFFMKAFCVAYKSQTMWQNNVTAANDVWSHPSSADCSKGFIRSTKTLLGRSFTDAIAYTILLMRMHTRCPHKLHITSRTVLATWGARRIKINFVLWWILVTEQLHSENNFSKKKNVITYFSSNIKATFKNHN